MLPLPGNRFPIDFNDPVYAELARRIEQSVGIPQGILDAIRTRGERTNANRISPAGARTPYQVIPATRRGILKNYGVDAWANPESATRAAALLLKENFDRSGDWGTAITQYHGGLNPKNWGQRTREYAERVGSAFDEDTTMPQRPAYSDIVNIPDSYDPRYLPTEVPERPTEPVPIPGPSMSVSQPSATTPPTKKKRGLLGTIGKVFENVFMPEPDSLWAAALRGGIYDAKANQRLYKQQESMNEIQRQMAEAKLRALMTKGEYQVVGNNVFHIPADGSEPRIIAPPANPGEKERLIEQWRRMDDADPAKELIRRMLLGANADEVLQNRENVARTRAGATTDAARIRASGTSNGVQYEYKVINGKLMRRRKN